MLKNLLKRSDVSMEAISILFSEYPQLKFLYDKTVEKEELKKENLVSLSQFSLETMLFKSVNDKYHLLVISLYDDLVDIPTKTYTKIFDSEWNIKDYSGNVWSFAYWE